MVKTSKMPKSGEIFEGKNSVIVQVEASLKGHTLNNETYTGFIEFTQNNCGGDFTRAVAAGLIDFHVFDARGSTNLYSIRGTKENV